MDYPPPSQRGRRLVENRRGVRQKLAGISVFPEEGGHIYIDITGVDILFPWGRPDRLGLFVFLLALFNAAVTF